MNRMDIKIDRDVMVPMRDGVRLATDIYRPVTETPVPALIVRLPYGKALAGMLADGRNLPAIMALAEAGYAAVWQDSRGSGNSEGSFTALQDETRDGEDLLQWLGEQPWCNGKFGAYGRSYLGFTEWSLAAGKVDGKLLAMVPSYTSADHYAGAFHHEGGLFSLNIATAWSFNMAMMQGARPSARANGSPPDVRPLQQAAAEGIGYYRRLPLNDRPALAGAAPWYASWFDHPDRDEYWAEISPSEHYDTMTTPSLNVGGWFDIFIQQTLSAYRSLRERGASEAARSGQRLLVGPWSHGVLNGVFPEMHFGPLGDMLTQDITGTHLRFYDRWINGNVGALDDTKPVRIFVMGINQWRDEADWPLPDTVWTDYYLSSAGRANTLNGDGVLSTQKPSLDAVDAYLYDPRRPVPTRGGQLYGGLPMVSDDSLAAGPADQRPNEVRDDVLCYTIDTLDHPIEVTGPITLVVHVSSSAKDTDFIAKLIDVHPDGRAMFVTEGAQRARYRLSTSQSNLLVPGEIYELKFELWGTANVFLPGHRLRLEITSSNFPRFDRNTNSGGDIGRETEDDFVVAVNRIYHGPDHPSRLILPIIDR
jgi:putative CocE/NonD family hydrolase